MNRSLALKRTDELHEEGDRLEKVSETSPDRLGHESKLTMNSQMSKVEHMNEMLILVEELGSLIKDEEWHNIPAPVRTTCEGFIAFQKKVTESIVFNAETAHKKVIALLEKQRKFEYKTKESFSEITRNMEMNNKKLSDRINQQKSDSKRDFTMNSEATSRLQNSIQSIQGTLEVWDGKIRRLDTKLVSMTELAQKLESSRESQTLSFESFNKKMKSMLEIPGLLGSEPSDAHKDIADFIKSLHAFKTS